MNDENEFDEAQLQMLRDKVKALPTEVAPNAASWKNIRDRIESSRVRALPTAVEVSSNAPTANSMNETALVAPNVEWWRTPRTVSLIAALLFAAVTTAVVMRERDTASTLVAVGDTVRTAIPEVVESTTVASAAGLRDTTVAVAPRRLDAAVINVLAQFNAAALDLTKDLDARRSRLQPDALAVVDSCLHTIDQAIRESREALVQSPQNQTIVDLLQVTYQQKLDLLRRAADLPMVSPQE